MWSCRSVYIAKNSFLLSVPSLFVSTCSHTFFAGYSPPAAALSESWNLAALGLFAIDPERAKTDTSVASAKSLSGSALMMLPQDRHSSAWDALGEEAFGKK